MAFNIKALKEFKEKQDAAKAEQTKERETKKEYVISGIISNWMRPEQGKTTWEDTVAIFPQVSEEGVVAPEWDEEHNIFHIGHYHSSGGAGKKESVLCNENYGKSCIACDSGDFRKRPKLYIYIQPLKKKDDKWVPSRPLERIALPYGFQMHEYANVISEDGYDDNMNLSKMAVWTLKREGFKLDTKYTLLQKPNNFYDSKFTYAFTNVHMDGNKEVLTLNMKPENPKWATREDFFKQLSTSPVEYEFKPHKYHFLCFINFLSVRGKYNELKARVESFIDRQKPLDELVKDDINDVNVVDVNDIETIADDDIPF